MYPLVEGDGFQADVLVSILGCVPTADSRHHLLHTLRALLLVSKKLRQLTLSDAAAERACRMIGLPAEPNPDGAPGFHSWRLRAHLQLTVDWVWYGALRNPVKIRYDQKYPNYLGDFKAYVDKTESQGQEQGE